MANPLTSREGTLGSMMTELKARLGFVTHGASSKLIDPLLKSFLQEGHEYVYEQLGAPLLKKRTTIMLQKGSKLYDCHNDIEDENFEPAMIESICVYDTETSFNELRQGITELMRCGDITPTVPERYDILDGQIELWPTPDDAYRMVVIYRPGLTRFTQPADHACVPSRLVFLYALASAKAHYPMPRLLETSFSRRCALNGRSSMKTSATRPWQTGRALALRFAARLTAGTSSEDHHGKHCL